MGVLSRWHQDVLEASVRFSNQGKQEGDLLAMRDLLETAPDLGSCLQLLWSVEIYAEQLAWSQGKRNRLREEMWASYSKKSVVCHVRGQHRPTKKRLAIVTHRLLPAWHGPTQEVLELALTAKLNGWEVLIVLAHGRPPKEVGPVWWMAEPYRANSLPRMKAVRYEGQEIPVVEREREATGPEYSESVVDVVSELISWNPEVCIVQEDFNPVGDAVTGAIPTVFHPTFHHRHATKVPVVMAPSSAPRVHGQQKHWLIQNGIARKPMPEHIRSNRKFRKKPTYLVVGNRLDVDICGKFADSCRAILRAVPGAKIVLAGNADPALSGEGIEYRGFQHDIASLYQECDVFLNPRRTGGGMSAFDAVHTGMPVITMDYGDVPTYANPVHSWPEYRCDAILCGRNKTGYEGLVAKQWKRRRPAVRDRWSSVERCLGIAKEIFCGYQKAEAEAQNRRKKAFEGEKPQHSKKQPEKP